MKALIKTAAMFCPVGRIVLENAPSSTLTTVHLLKELQIKLDKSLEHYYTQKVKLVLDQKSEEKPIKQPALVR